MMVSYYGVWDESDRFAFLFLFHVASILISLLSIYIYMCVLSMLNAIIIPKHMNCSALDVLSGETIP